MTETVTERTLLIGLLEAHIGPGDDPVLSTYLRDVVVPGLRDLPVSTELDAAQAKLERARELGLPDMIDYFQARVAELEQQVGAGK